MKQERPNKEKYRIYVITLRYQIVNEKNQIKKESKNLQRKYFYFKEIMCYNKLKRIIYKNRLWQKKNKDKDPA